MQGGNLWDYIQSISAYVSPPWVVVFLCGILWNRSTEKVRTYIRETFYTASHSQKPVSVYFLIRQILTFGFEEHFTQTHVYTCHILL